MTVIRNDFGIDGLFGIVYDFTEVGDGIPPHVHGPRDSHLVIVTNGRFRMHSRGNPHQDVGPGYVVNYPMGIEHWNEVIELPPDRPARAVFIFRFFLPESELDKMSRETGPLIPSRKSA